MEKKNKLVLAGLVSAGLAALLLWKGKKTYQKLEKRDAENENYRKNCGYCVEEEEEKEEKEEVQSEPEIKMKKEVKKVEKLNLNKAVINYLTEHKDLIPDESFNVKNSELQKAFIDENGNKQDIEEKIHVMQGRERGRNVVHLLFEVPLDCYADKEERINFTPYNISDFLNVLRGNKDDENDNGFISNSIKNLGNYVNVLSTEPRQSVTPSSYYYVRYFEKAEGEENWTEKIELRHIPDSEWREEFSRDSKYVAFLKKESQTKALYLPKYDSDNVKEFEVLNAFFAIKVTLAIKDKHYVTGIDVEGLCKLLEDVFDNLQISSKHYTKKPWDAEDVNCFMYNYILFYKPEAAGKILLYGEENGEIVEEDAVEYLF